MNTDQLTEKIGVELASLLPGFDWVSQKSRLIKQFDDGWIAIVIGIIPTSKHGMVKLTTHGQIRINELEDTYTPFNIYLSTPDAREHATISLNCDTLMRDSAIIHGFSIDENDVSRFVIDYACQLREKVIPWLDKYRNEESLLDGLSSDLPREWITSDRLTRFPVLLAILSRRGEWKEFEKVAEDFLHFCEKAHGLVHRAYAEAVTSGLRQLR